MFDFGWNGEKLLDLGRSFWPCRILLTAAELDLFTVLAKEPLRAADVAVALRADGRAITMLLDALAAMNLLDKNKETYRTRDEVAPWLTRESPVSILPMLLHSASLWQRWSQLTVVVQKGGPATVERSPEEAEASLQAFIGAMHSVGLKNAELIVALIDLGGIRRIIDVGGASGTYAIAFARRDPHVEITLFDRPQVVPMARERISEAGLLDRVEIVGGDFYIDELPAGYDLALLSAIIHQNSRSQNCNLFAKVYRSLNPGGKLIIRDHIMNDSHTQPAAGALFAINMLVGTQGGGTYSFSEIEEDLKQAGFAQIRLVQSDERMDGLVQAIKSCSAVSPGRSA